MNTPWHAADAASLTERLAGLVSPTEARGTGGEALQRTWRAIVGGESDVRWERRMAALGPTPHPVSELLGPVQSRPGRALPWKHRVEALLEYARQFADPPASTDAGAGPEVPFRELLAPLAEVGLARARATTQGGAQLRPAAWDQLRRQLHWRLAALSEPTLGLEFAVFRAQRRSSLAHLLQIATAPQSSELYGAFVGDERHTRLWSLTVRYPALARGWAALVDDWVEATTEMLQRLHDDAHALARFLGLAGPLPAVRWVRPDLSDSHHGGRTVAHLVFDGGAEVIYKPRNIEVEARWTELLAWIADRGGPVRLAGLDVLGRDDHGWVEVAKARPCASADEFAAFYERAGALLCLVYLLAGTDCHRDNIIADGAVPILVDAETLMHPGRPLHLSGDQDAHTVLSHQLHHSVLSTALLPHWSPTPAGGGFEGSGIGPGGALSTTVHLPLPTARNTDAASVKVQAVTLASAQNVPHCNGQYAVADQYMDALVAGFESTARFVLQDREALLAADGPLMGFRETRVRVLLRATASYDVVRDRARNPAAMRNGAARSVVIDAVVRPLLRVSGSTDSRAALWEAARLERAAIERNDIPRFEISADASAVDWRSDWSCSGLQIARDRIASLDDAEIQRQIGLIEASFEARDSTLTERDHGVASRTGSSIVDDDEIRAQVRRITDRIKGLATQGAQRTVTWQTIDVLQDSRAYRLHAMGPTLYNGVSGVALYLAAASIELEDLDARQLALGAVDSLRAQLVSDGPFAAGTCVGGVMGTPSVAYALAWMGHLLDDTRLVDDALTMVRRFDDDVIRADSNYDLSAGAAGLVLVLLALHSIRPEPDLLDRARVCGEHLLQSRSGTPATWPTPTGQRLAGLAHGASGIAWALQRLTEETGESRYREAAFEALEYERTLFHAEVGNWQDVRPDVPGPGPSFMNAWCNGAAGIGLARVAQVGAPRRDEELAAALRTTRQAAFGHLDHLCCGNVGRSELLLEAGLVKASRRVVDAMVTRANEQGTWTLTRHPRPSTEHAGLFRGLSGIGWHLLRHLRPGWLPTLGLLGGLRQRQMSDGGADVVGRPRGT